MDEVEPGTIFKSASGEVYRYSVKVRPWWKLWGWKKTYYWEFVEKLTPAEVIG